MCIFLKTDKSAMGIFLLKIVSFLVTDNTSFSSSYNPSISFVSSNSYALTRKNRKICSPITCASPEILAQYLVNYFHHHNGEGYFWRNLFRNVSITVFLDQPKSCRTGRLEKKPSRWFYCHTSFIGNPFKPLKSVRLLSQCSSIHPRSMVRR